MNADDEAARLAHIRRWGRPDFERWLRPDWERYVHPAGHDAVRREIELHRKAFEPPPCASLRLRDEAIERERLREEAIERERLREEQAALESELAWQARCAEHKRRADAAWDRFMAVLRQYLSQKAGFNPDQPRDELGRWTDNGGETVGQSDNVRLAASEGLPIGPRAMLRLLSQIGKRAIEAYRSENLLYGLFDNKRGSVSLTTIDGKDIFGTNRGSQLWDRSDEQDWRRLRDIIAEKYPELAKENLGELPLNALTHSEVNVLLRTAREHGGSLAGRNIDVFTDKPMCTSCPIVLPYVTRELGNPTVTYTYVGPKGPGKSRTIENGEWKPEMQQ
jgi:hypothetical protein